MTGDSKFFLGVVVTAILVVAGIFIFTRNHSSYSTVNLIDGQKLGPDTAKVKIVEFSDFQCPACAQAYLPLDQVQKNNPNDVQIIYRFFPLTQIHKNAISSAMAALAAAAQGKFWEMADLLFENQSSWESLSSPTDTFVNYARQLGLNTTQFTKDMSNPTFQDTITTDANYATSLDLTSTPTFFINEKKIIGGRSLEDWQKLVDEAKQ